MIGNPGDIGKLRMRLVDLKDADRGAHGHHGKENRCALAYGF